MNTSPSKRSGEYFSSGYYCAESVLLAISEANGIKSEIIPKIATGMCAGLARTCGLCGAVSGALMSINLVYGRSLPGESVEENFKKVQEFLNRFEKEFGSTNCKELTGCDLGTDEGQEYFEANNIRNHCQKYTENAAVIALSIINED
jgi:C_GCAxxG_C_C family probable redox protein